MKVVILEEKALAGIARRERQPQEIAAIGVDAGGAEAVAVRLDVNVARPRGFRRKCGDTRGESGARDENQQRCESAGRRIARFPGL